MKSPFNYRLALDLGTTSIGWAVLRLDSQNNPYALIKCGSRIFSDGRHPKDGTSLAVQRRNARQMRRRRDRLLKRTKRMINKLVQHGFFPSDASERAKLVNLDPYLLRERGLDHQITPAEFGRIMMHLSKRRGFKSNRKTDTRDNDQGLINRSIREMHQVLEADKCRTLGEWLARRHKVGLGVRSRLSGTKVADKAYSFYSDRAMVESEFDTLWAAQNKYNPEVFSDEARADIKDTLLFQRCLVPVLPGRCTLLPDEPRAPLALPSQQRFRILQELNNLRLIDRGLVETVLTIEQRNQLLDTLLRKKSMKFTAIRKLLKLPAGITFNLESGKRDGLKGDITSAMLSDKKLFGPEWFEWTLEKQDNIVSQILNEESEEKLLDSLMADTPVDEVHAREAMNIALPAGYGRLSEKALNQLLPHLINAVVTFDKAVLESGLGSHSQLTDIEKTGEILSELPYYGIPLQRHVAFAMPNPINEEQQYGKIANPTVHIGLNQIRVVVNSLIRRYGHPAQIHVEVTRELKLSRENKQRIDNEQALRQKVNAKRIKTACEILKTDPDSLDVSQRRHLWQKMQLWEELGREVSDRKCPFSGEQIGIEKLLSDEVEIEHLLPYSRTLDDSLSNKTLAIREANRIKTNKTPFEAFGHEITGKYAYPSILARAANMPMAKRRRFAEDALEKWSGENDFLARALNDTAYFSRVARTYLCCICQPSQVLALPGRLTAMIRGKLGLNTVISNGDTKNRDDHRHHAVDAIVLGITDRAFLAKVARANHQARSQQLTRLIADMPDPWPTFRDHVVRAVNQINVSHRPDHGYQGAMHNDTAWGLIGDGRVVRSVTIEGSSEKQKVVQNQKVIEISEPGLKRHGFFPDGSARPYKGYVGNSNYCIEIWLDEGKWKSSVISTFQAYQAIAEFGPEQGWRKLRRPNLSLNGNPLVMRLMINDYLKLAGSKTTGIFRVVQISGNGQITLALPHEANVDSRNRDKSNSFTFFSKKASSLQKDNALLLSVSPIGKISFQKRGSNYAR